MCITLSLRPNRAIFHHSSADLRPPARPLQSPHVVKLFNNVTRRATLLNNSSRGWWSLSAGSRADDSSPMTVENALKLLGVSESDSFDDILRAKNSILASCKDDPYTIAQVSSSPFVLTLKLFFVKHNLTLYFWTKRETIFMIQIKSCCRNEKQN